MVSPSYSCNTRTVTRTRTSPGKPNNLEAWITTIGSSNSFGEILKAVEEVESTLVSEEKVRRGKNNKMADTSKLFAPKALAFTSHILILFHVLPSTIFL